LWVGCHYLGFWAWKNNHGFLGFKPAENSRGLNNIDVFVEVFREAVVCGSNKTVTAGYMLPNIVFLGE
jgi:hypothetical protein